MTITDATITTSVYTDVRTKIVNSLATNSDATLSATFNDKKFTKKQIIMTPPIVTEDIDKFGVGSQGKKAISVVITTTAANTLELASLRDEVVSILVLNDIDGIDLINYDESYGMNEYNSNKYHEKVLSFVYQRE